MAEELINNPHAGKILKYEFLEELGELFDYPVLASN